MPAPTSRVHSPANPPHDPSSTHRLLRPPGLGNTPTQQEPRADRVPDQRRRERPRLVHPRQGRGGGKGPGGRGTAIRRKPVLPGLDHHPAHQPHRGAGRRPGSSLRPPAGRGPNGHLLAVDSDRKIHHRGGPGQRLAHTGRNLVGTPRTQQDGAVHGRRHPQPRAGKHGGRRCRQVGSPGRRQRRAARHGGPRRR